MSEVRFKIERGSDWAGQEVWIILDDLDQEWAQCLYQNEAMIIVEALQLLNEKEPIEREA